MMMATRRSRLRATRRLAKTWILRRLPKTRSRSTMMMATGRSSLRATGRLAKTRVLRTKMLATKRRSLRTRIMATRTMIVSQRGHCSGSRMVRILSQRP